MVLCMIYKIYLSPPSMGGKEIEFVQEAFAANWIAPAGPALKQFEDEITRFAGVGGSLAVSSGTAAIHLCLRYLDVKPGDVVFCSDMTFIGSCNPIIYQGGTPVFIDCEPGSFNMSPAALARGLKRAAGEGRLPKAVIIVDLYGESADYDRLLPICSEYGVPVIEDAAEAVGVEYKGKKCGSFGIAGTYSFNGNKILTTAGGGMVLSQNQAAIEKMRFWSTQAKEPCLYYEHKEIGYNYRMSNICASIGLGQLRFLENKIERRREVHRHYAASLKHLPAHIKEPSDSCTSNYWLSVLVLDDDRLKPEDLVLYLQIAGIEARLAWKPMHMQPVYKDCRFFPHESGRMAAEEIFQSCVCLPSGDSLTPGQQQMVIDRLTEYLEAPGPVRQTPG